MVFYIVTIFCGFMILNTNLRRHHQEIEYKLDLILERLNKRSSDDS
jgi:hypothetical protein